MHYIIVIIIGTIAMLIYAVKVKYLLRFVVHGKLQLSKQYELRSTTDAEVMIELYNKKSKKIEKVTEIKPGVVKLGVRTQDHNQYESNMIMKKVKRIEYED